MSQVISACGGGGGSALVPQFGLYTSNDQSIAAGATTTMEWVYSAGVAVLDLTDPFQPVPKTQGVYWVSCQCTSGTLGWTAGRSLKAEISLVNATFPINGTVYIFANALGNMLIANPQALSPLATSDFLALRMQNADTGARIMRGNTMSVVRIGTY